LGNFVFDGFEDEDNMTGWALFANVDKKGVSSVMTRGVRMDVDARHKLPTLRELPYPVGA